MVFVWKSKRFQSLGTTPINIKMKCSFSDMLSLGVIVKLRGMSEFMRTLCLDITKQNIIGTVQRMGNEQ